MDLSCPICYEEYKLSDERLPRLLLVCGHSLCTSCLSKINDYDIPRCPMDKIKLEKRDNVEEFPVNYGLRSVIEARAQTQRCPNHSKKLRYFCVTDRCKICSECLYDQHQGHDLQNFDEIKKKADNCLKNMENLSDKVKKSYRDTLEDIEENRKIQLMEIDSASDDLIQTVLFKNLCLRSEVNLIYDMNKKKIEDLLGESSILSKHISTMESDLKTILRQEDLLKPFEDFQNILPELTNKHEDITNSNISKQNVNEGFIRAKNCIELSFQNQREALRKIKINPGIESLSDLSQLKRFLDLRYQDNCLYLSNSKDTNHGIKIDLNHWIEAEKLDFTFDKEISEDDLSLLAYIWDNLKHPLALKLNFANKTLTKGLYDIFCSNRHNFKDISIKIGKYKIESQSLIVSFIREIFSSAKNITAVELLMEGADFADDCAERIFNNGIFDPNNLRHLSINLCNTNVKDQDLKGLIVAMPQLNKFQFYADFTPLTNATLISWTKSTLASTQVLQTIHISVYGTQITDGSIENLDKYLNSTQITSLRLLLGDTKITDRSLELLSNTMIRLNMFNTLSQFDLNLSNNNISDKSLDQIFLPMPNMRELLLGLSNNSVIWDDLILQLSEVCLASMKKLESCSLYLGFTEITDSCLNQLLKNLKGIKEIFLNLNGTRITDKTLELFVQEKISDEICDKLNIEVSSTKINTALKEKLKKISTEGLRKYRQTNI